MVGLVLSAYDRGPNKMLQIMADVAQRRGHKVVMFPPLERGYAASHAREAADCDLALLGLSSFQTQEELDLVEKLTCEIWVIEDVPGSSLRPLAREYAGRFERVLVASPAVEAGARAFGYRNVSYLGPPPHWQQSFQEMQGAIEKDIRSNLRKFRNPGFGDSAPINPEDRIIYVPGNKEPEVVNRVLRFVKEAATELMDGRLVIGFKKHGGEKPEKPEDQERFRVLWQEREEILSGVWCLDIGEYTNAELVASAHITVFSGGPTESITGAFARLPIIYYWDETVAGFLRKQGSADGCWFVAELGGAYRVVDPQTMKEGIHILLHSAGRSWLRKRQERAFPLPETWDTAGVILELVEKAFAKTGS